MIRHGDAPQRIEEYVGKVKRRLSDAMFDHRKLKVYERSRVIARQIHALLKAAPKRRLDLIDQLNRAVASLVLNIAEGAGEYRPREKARFYWMARRSAHEASSVLDLLVDVEILLPSQTLAVQQDIMETVAMLVRLAQNLDKKAI